MAERKVALCPTLAAGDAIAQYGGWQKGVEPEPARLARKRATFRAALDAGVTILSGSDVGVFAHGDNARELELMVDYGMSPLDALESATSVAARVLHMDDRLGRVRARACWPTWSPSTATPPRHQRAGTRALRHEGGIYAGASTSTKLHEPIAELVERSCRVGLTRPDAAAAATVTLNF